MTAEVYMRLHQDHQVQDMITRRVKYLELVHDHLRPGWRGDCVTLGVSGHTSPDAIPQQVVAEVLEGLGASLLRPSLIRVVEGDLGSGHGHDAMPRAQLCIAADTSGGRVG